MNIEKFFNTENVKRFYFPGKIFLGDGVSLKAIELLGSAKCIAIVVDEVFIKSLIYKEIVGAARSANVFTWTVRGAPYAQDILEFIGKIEGVPDVVISIGGGSAADFAKSIILQELFGSISGIGVGEKVGVLPREGSKRPIYIAIPTTAGSGAEASRYFVTYDKNTHSKVYGKTWQVVADWIFLDPNNLSSMPELITVSCAFDAFVHLFESYVTRYECSDFAEMLTLDAIPRIMLALHEGVIVSKFKNKNYEQLLYAATIAGVAISNVRTGHIHEAAGALLEITNLSHAETLFVFFRSAIMQYKNEIGEKSKRLIDRLRLNKEFLFVDDIEDIICWWEDIFKKVGLDKKISVELQGLDLSVNHDKYMHIFNRVYSDKVWVEKESPKPLREIDIEYFIKNSINSHKK